MHVDVEYKNGRYRTYLNEAGIPGPVFRLMTRIDYRSGKTQYYEQFVYGQETSEIIRRRAGGRRL